MIGPDLVRVQRRGDKLTLTAFGGKDREEAARMAAELIDIAKSAEGLSLEEVSELLEGVSRLSKHEKVWAGLRKLVLDACEFEESSKVEASALRAEVFALASQKRRQAVEGEKFDRNGVLGEVARKFDIGPEAVDEGLFSDLKGAALLVRAPRLEAEELLSIYDRARIQGVLLRAVSLTVTLKCESPDVLRALFHKLKFRRLLYRLTATGPGRYELCIDGPFSLFESVTKYGLQLAQMVSAFGACEEARLSAVVLWGKDRRKLNFECDLGGLSPSDEAPPLRSEVAALLEDLAKKDTPFAVTPAREILDVPGQGLCIPDLEFRAKGGPPVYVEVLGYWSREAVIRRVEWVESGASPRVVFAVSSKLRVKEEILPEETRSSLYVYKGTMNAQALLRHVEGLASPS